MGSDAALVKFLKGPKAGAISILADETTKNHRNILMVLLQGVENNQPMTWFYRAIELSDASAQSIFDAIKTEWEADGLIDSFKQNLRGLGSDGASNMRAVSVSLCALLNAFAIYEVICTHCMAHKLNLAGKWSIKN